MTGARSMSEQHPPSSAMDHETHHTPQDAPAHEITPGTYLRDARESAGLHLPALAAALKVSVAKLEALEQDQLHLLPDAAFTRALASSVCRMLKLDPVPVLERLPPLDVAKFVFQDRGINETFKHRNIGQSSSIWAQISRPAVLAGLVLLLGALVLIFLPTLRGEAASANAGGDSAFVSAPTMLSLTGLLPGEIPEATANDASDVVAAEELTTNAPQRVTRAEDTVSPATVAPVDGAVVPVASTPVVLFNATGASWVQVTDAKGAVVLNRTLKAGDTAEVSGVLPLAAVVGRADVTQVQVRGQAFDLGAVSKNNVARFEVK